MDFPSFSSSEELTDHSDRFSGIEPLDSSGGGTIADHSDKLSGIEPLDSSSGGTIASNAQDSDARSGLSGSDTSKPAFRISGHRLGGQVLYWRTMASVPGGPPMASGAAESDMGPGEGQNQQDVRGQGARPRGSRVQLFREQPMSGSPDGAANGSGQVSHPPPMAPPPDLVQSQVGARQGDSHSHTDARQRELLVEQYGGSSGTVGIHTGMINQPQPSLPQDFRYTPEHAPPYQPNPLGIGPDGHNINDHSGSASWQGMAPGRAASISHSFRSMQPDMDSSLAFNTHGNSIFYEELRSSAISAGHEGSSADGQPAHGTGGSLGTGYIAGNIQILAPEQNNSFCNENGAALQQITEPRPVAMGVGKQITGPRPVAMGVGKQITGPRPVSMGVGKQLEVEARPVILRLSPLDRDERSPDDSVESGMYVEPPDQDLSCDEFMPLENDEPEGATSSQSHDDTDYDLEYEDNTEVDQDVVLQPEADQTGYEESDDVEGQEPIPRASAFQPISGGAARQTGHGNRGNGSAPVYITPRTVPINVAQQAGMVASGGYHGNLVPAAGNALHGFMPQAQSMQHAAQNASLQAQDMIQGNGNTNPEDDQVPIDQASGSGNQGNQVLNVADHSNQDRVNNNPSQGKGQGQELLGAAGGATVGSSFLDVQQHKHKILQQQASCSESSQHKHSVQTSAGELSVGQGSRPKQAVDRPKSSTESGTNAGKQHTGVISKTSKTQNQSKRTKIRTLPPKMIGASAAAGRITAPKSKAQNISSSRGKATSRGQQQSGSQRQNTSTRPRTSTNAKSPNRVPPQRQAPSGGDSSTAPMVQGYSSQGQSYSSQSHGSLGQGHLQQAIQGGQYTLAGLQETYNLPLQQVRSHDSYGAERQDGLYVGHSIGHIPNREHDRDRADGFMRPNPIGEIDAGVRGLGPQNNGLQSNTQQDMNSGIHDNHVMVMPRQQPINTGGLNQPLLGNHVHLVTDMMVGDGDGEESSDPPRQPVVQHNTQQATYVGYPARGQDQLLERQVPGTSQANYSAHLPLQPLHIPPPQPPQARSTSPIYPHNPNHQPQYSTNFYTHHLLPSNQLDSAQNVSINASQHHGATSQQHGATSLQHGATSQQHGATNHGKAEPPYGTWERSLELSPISRTSTATDRVQTTLQRSPGASSNRDAGHNLSFASAMSDRPQQVIIIYSKQLHSVKPLTRERSQSDPTSQVSAHRR